MSKRFTRVGRIVLISVCWPALAALPAAAQQGNSRAAVVRLIHHGESRPLRDIPPLPARAERRIIPLRRPSPVAPTALADPVVQLSAGTFVSTTAGTTFDGLGQGAYGFTVRAAPPDPNGAVGATQYVQWVNLSFAIFDKATGVLLYGPAAGNTPWQGSGLTACANNNDGDPIIEYDKAANRWVFTQISFTGGPPYYQCIAISQTSDATGPYYLYALQWVNNTLPDYPKLGVWPDAYYMSFNLFSGGIFFIGAQACALDRSLMLQNLDATVQCFTLAFSAASLLPSDLDGVTPPPAGSPDFFLTLGSNSLSLYRFHVDFANSNNTTLTGPISIPVASFNKACGGGTCIPQSGTSQQLDSIGDRLMYRLAYRNFGDHESLVVNHSVNPGRKKSNNTTGVSAVRWYEIRNPNGTPVVYQQGTYAPDASSRWMGSIAMDKVGDIAVGYSVSSPNIHPAIRFTGRVPSDPLGSLEGEGRIFEGTGSQTQNLNRWGDYTSMSIDPVDDCTFWYTNEYLLTNGTFNWSTRIASFKFPGCL